MASAESSGNPFSGLSEKTDDDFNSPKVIEIMQDLNTSTKTPKVEEPVGLGDDPNLKSFLYEMEEIRGLSKGSSMQTVDEAIKLNEEVVLGLRKNAKQLRARLAQNTKFYSEQSKMLDGHLTRRLNSIRDIKEEKDKLIAENKRLRQKVKELEVK